ncbi:MAG: radical SAM protein [Verrucomicrobiota bacterium]
MFLSLAFRALRTVDPRLLLKLGWNFGVKNLVAVEKFKRRIKRGEYFPPFLQISILNSCNLRCQGCWVDVDGPAHRIDLAAMNRLINDAKRHGNAFFGILGGEPFLHPELFDILAAHPDCYFQVFTNGQAITQETAKKLRALGNVTPLVSIEGSNVVSDERRGSQGVFDKSMRGLENCLRERLITGVATSVCQSNIDDLLSEKWLRELIRLGAHYVWFYTYRPVGGRSNPQLALSQEQLVRVRRFVTEMRAKLPIGIVDCYYDHDGTALCPMTTGASHHVNPRGEIEPCPLIQFAVENIADARGIYETVRDSAFLRDFREVTGKTTRGCIILERPDIVRDLVLKHGARDTTLRGTALAELEAMQPQPSQWMPEHEIPERHWMYRFAKKYWFNDFGAYQGKAKKP